MGQPSSFISFFDEGIPRGMKTHVFRVVSGISILGTVKWWAPWRCYSFFPGIQTLFKQKCLRQIADFCESETKKHKNRKKENVTP